MWTSPSLNNADPSWLKQQSERADPLCEELSAHTQQEHDVIMTEGLRLNQMIMMNDEDLLSLILEASKFTLFLYQKQVENSSYLAKKQQHSFKIWKEKGWIFHYI